MSDVLDHLNITDETPDYYDRTVGEIRQAVAAHPPAADPLDVENERRKQIVAAVWHTIKAFYDREGYLPALDGHVIHDLSARLARVPEGEQR